MRPRDFTALGLFAREGFLDERCRRAVLMAARDGDAAEVLADGRAAFGVHVEVRRAWEVTLPDPLETEILSRLDAIRPRIEAWWGQPLARCDAIAVLRYPEGAFYRSHRDRPLPVPTAPPTAGTIRAPAAGFHRRRVSVVIFVNDHAAFGGGHLRLFDLPGDDDGLGLDLAPEAGALIAFPSDVLHEVRPVTAGVRVTIVAWLLAA